MEKLLAALSLPQVGGIRIISADEDPENIEGLFALELTSRVYTLRAKSNAEAELWVKTLSKLRAQGSLSTLSPAAFVTASNGFDGDGDAEEGNGNAIGKKKLMSGVEVSSAGPTVTEVHKETVW
eukprot:CAMPEP_0119045246 /NCGR_PEP_ID=MMETSP1177-20130426/38428_1 /TAXON_ID=2985 /ORGANISM="Ochromonas sp, Strain CCMP1899" /LENGTH=123 /DNA_ID=CAMNT_0007016713 /DNA_START=325 /DNA_END=693 /DNA_ORIENTATION=-